MVRHYKRKTDKASYSKDKLIKAIAAVRKGELSAYRASIVFGIPRPTIVNRLYDRRGLKSNTLGRSTVLSREVEENLARNLHTMERYGFGLTRKEILELVGKFVTTNNIPNPFKNGIPGEFWFLGFKERHNLSVKKPQAVENSRKKACNPFVVYPYFDMLKVTLDELDLHDKPSHIWNLDETSFSKDPSKTKVVGLKGYAATRTISSPGKDNTTVLLGCNAVGEKTPPLIIYKGKNVWDEWTSKEDYPGTVYAATKNGWMETQVFETFFEKVFLKTVGKKRPILLMYDGHSTHVGIKIIEKARASNVTILKIPPHTSDNLQPLDLAVNKSFKDKWDLALVKWQRLHVGQILPKKEFSKIIGEVWTQVDPGVCAAAQTPGSTCGCGFRKGGIVPYNRHAIPEEKFHSDKLEEWNMAIAQKKAVVAPGTPTLPTVLSNHFEPIEEVIHRPTISNYLFPILQPDQTQHENNGTSKQSSNTFHPPTLMKMCLNTWNCHLEYTAPITDPAVVLDKGIQISDERSATDFVLSITSTHETHQEKENKTDNIIIDTRNLSIVALDYDISLKSKQDTKKLSTHIQTKINVVDDQRVNLNTSFNDLLLSKIKSGTSNKQKRTKIAEGAEVITSEDVYRRRKLTEEENTRKIKIKEEKQAKKFKNKANNLKKPKKNTKRRKIDELSSESEMEIGFDDDTDSDHNYDNYCANIAADEQESDHFINTANYNQPTTSTNYKTRKIKIQEEKQAKKLKNKENNLKKPKKVTKIAKRRKIDELSSESEIEIHFDDDTDSDFDYDNYCANVVADEEESDLSNYIDIYNEPTTRTSYKTKKHYIENITSQNYNESHLDESNIKFNNNHSEIILGADEEQNSQSKKCTFYDESATSTIKQGQWGLVKFATKKNVKHFVGVVTDLNDNGTPTMKFVRKSLFGSEDKIVFVFPNVPDICQVKHLEDIVILPSPTKGRRGQITFKMSFAGYNVQ